MDHPNNEDIFNGKEEEVKNIMLDFFKDSVPANFTSSPKREEVMYILIPQIANNPPKVTPIYGWEKGNNVFSMRSTSLENASPEFFNSIIPYKIDETKTRPTYFTYALYPESYYVPLPPRRSTFEEEKIKDDSLD